MAIRLLSLNRLGISHRHTTVSSLSSLLSPPSLSAPRHHSPPCTALHLSIRCIASASATSLSPLCYLRRTHQSHLPLPDNLAQKIGKTVRRAGAPSKVRVYADIHVIRPKEYWDYEALTVQWG